MIFTTILGYWKCSWEQWDGRLPTAAVSQTIVLTCGDSLVSSEWEIRNCHLLTGRERMGGGWKKMKGDEGGEEEDEGEMSISQGTT